MKKFNCLLLILLFIPCGIKANIMDKKEVVSINEKYYKTTYYLNPNYFPLSTISNSSSNSIEITKEEYDSIDEQIITNGNASVETTYKKLTTYILESGNYFRYKVVLTWKNFPKVRSYDIIAIGFYPSVKMRGTIPNFSQKYCKKNNDCKTITTNNPQKFTQGVGTTFKLPEGDLTSLSQTFYFDVEKNTDATIIKQIAAGDYSHSIRSVSLSEGKNYTATQNGISIIGTNANYFDDIGNATAVWTGNW